MFCFTLLQAAVGLHLCPGVQLEGWLLSPQEMKAFVCREKCAFLGTSPPPGLPSMEALSGLPPGPQSREKSYRWL